ncbi:MAG: alpha-amylase family protein [Thermoguttaceae bacterium]
MKDNGWTRREVLKGAVTAAIGFPFVARTAFSLGAPLATTRHRLAPDDDLEVPDWIAYGKLRWVWALWEPLQFYRRNGGGAGGITTGPWLEKWFHRMHSDEILDQLAEVGINLVSTHYYKGFGLQAEAAEMDLAADFTRRAHARGIRVLGYHQFNTVVHETMLKEVPELAQWIQRGEKGEMLTYAKAATWRWNACPIHDEYLAYVKRVMDQCLNHAGMDGVEFDGTRYLCHCKKCTEAFRRYLTERYPTPPKRFGVSDFTEIVMPAEDAWGTDPLRQELARFRWDVHRRRFREMREFVHRRKPGAALATYLDLIPGNPDWYDLAIAENHDTPQVLDGALITKVRSLKRGTAVGRVTFSTNWLRNSKGGILMPKKASTVELDMAEALACGGQICAATWALRPAENHDGAAFFEQPEFHAALKRYMGFARDHEPLYVDSQSAANVWMYHSGNSQIGFEQALLGRIAYRVANESRLKQLGDRDVLILVNETSLSDAECAAIRAASERGCALILTGATGRRDERSQVREPLPFADLLDRPNVRYFAKCPGQIPLPPKGSRMAVLPVMPKRAAEILKAVEDVAKKGLAARLDGGDAAMPMTYVDVYRLPDACVVHVIYYGDDKPKGLRIRLGDWLARDEQPVLYSPYLAEPVTLKPSDDGSFELPESFVRYAAIRFKAAAS